MCICEWSLCVLCVCVNALGRALCKICGVLCAKCIFKFVRVAAGGGGYEYNKCTICTDLDPEPEFFNI
jgi:hypothetical protein